MQKWSDAQTVILWQAQRFDLCEYRAAERRTRHPNAFVALRVTRLKLGCADVNHSILKKAIGRDWKGRLSTMLYVVAIIATLRSSWIAQAILVIAALIWPIPDRRIEKRLA